MNNGSFDGVVITQVTTYEIINDAGVAQELAVNGWSPCTTPNGIGFQSSNGMSSIQFFQVNLAVNIKVVNTINGQDQILYEGFASSFASGVNTTIRLLRHYAGYNPAMSANRF